MSEDQKPKAVWNPQKQYRWEPTQVFKITGQQFADFFHLLNNEANTPGGALLGMKINAYNTMINIFKKGVEDGDIVDAEVAATELAEDDPTVLKLFPNKQ